MKTPVSERTSTTEGANTMNWDRIEGNWKQFKGRAVAALAAALGLVSGADALADPMSKAEYQVARRDIQSDFKGSRIGCEPMLGPVKEICLVEVSGRETVALAELEAAYLPSARTRNDAHIAKAQAGYALALKKCDYTAAPAKDACLKDAEAFHVAARADPEAQAKTAAINAGKR
jgi:hypothetical protein